MRNLLLVAWLLLPVGAGAYHMGPGQDRLREDDAARHLTEAGEFAATAAALAISDGEDAALDDWIAADRSYQLALENLPPKRMAARRKAMLERAKCQMQISELPEANRTLRGLVDELLSDDEQVEPALLRDAQQALASSEYYMTWLSRLEGSPREKWLPRIESARQIQRLLASSADTRGDSGAAAIARADLESAIRLERMDLSELQGLPLPSQ